MFLRFSDSGCIAPVFFKIIKAKISAIVYDLDVPIQPERGLLLTHTVRGGEKDHMEIIGAIRIIGIDEG